MINLIVFFGFSIRAVIYFSSNAEMDLIIFILDVTGVIFSDTDTTTGVWGIQNNRVGLISSHDNINIPTTCFTYLEKQTNKQWNKWWIISLLILTTTRQVHYLIFMGWMFLNFYCVLLSFFYFIYNYNFAKRAPVHIAHIYTQTYIYFACIWFIKQ